MTAHHHHVEEAQAANDAVVPLEDVRWARGLRRCREALGLTQDQLARLSGMSSKTQVCALETGRNMFTRHKLLGLGAALGITTTADVIRYLERWSSDEVDDDSDLVDEDPPTLTEAQYEAAMRDLADESSLWKQAALDRRHQLEVVAEMLVAGDADGARHHLASVLEEVRRG